MAITFIEYNLNICGNIELIEKIQSILIEKCGLNKTIISHPKKQSSNVSILRYSGNRQLKRIREYLYNEASFYIKRKHKKFHEMTFVWKN